MTRPSPERQAELLELVDAAQRVAGAIAARERGDPDGAAELLASLTDDGMLGQGALLLTDLLLQLHLSVTGDGAQTTLQNLSLRLEARIRAA